MRMGRILTMPLPQMLQTMTVPSATKASSQLAWQLLMAEGARIRPMADDDGARDHRREELHDAADAEGGDQQADHQIHQAREGHARAGVGQHLRVGDGQVAVGVGQHGGHDGKAAQISKGRAQEGRDLALGDEVEQQRAQTCAQQGGGDAQAGQQRHQNGGAEHGEHVLHAQNKHPAACPAGGHRKCPWNNRWFDS